MLVLDTANNYSFANMVIKVTDNTVQQDDTKIPTPDIPDFNVLIPTVQDVGITNTLEFYYPGEPYRYLKAHGMPNALKYGFGPDLVHDIIEYSAANVGVYTINLRGPSATMANVIVSLKYKVEKDVPYKTTTGDQYYLSNTGELVTVAGEGSTEVKRDVLHVKFVTSSINNCKKWIDLNTAMNNSYSETPDDAGYKTIPWFAIMYKGATAFGNNAYFNMVPSIAEFDGHMYYKLNVYDGNVMNSTEATYSFDVNAGESYGTSYYIENMFNSAFTTMQFITAEGSDVISDLFNKYAYTVNDYINGKMNTPSVSFTQIDPFMNDTTGTSTRSLFGIQADAGSLNTMLTNAIVFANGTDGTETADELYKMFFNGEIIGDIASPIRYRITYIPDMNYNAETKTAIINLVKKRNHMTSSTIMIGGLDTFSSALLDHQSNYYDNMPNIRQIAKVQSPMRYNSFIKRTIVTPATYFDTMALMRHFAKYSNAYQPAAGADVRWLDFLEDTIQYPSEVVDYINSLQTSRINFVMKDARDGAYLADQQMNTLLASDQTELNNAFLISSMLYDLVNLVHYNHFKFNEAEQVQIFKETVDDKINNKYKSYAASLSVDVYRLGTIGRAKSANKIVVRINMKDINKFTDVDIILTDE